MYYPREYGKSWGREVAAQREVDYCIHRLPPPSSVTKHSFAELGITSNVHPLVGDESNMKVDDDSMIGQS